MKPTLRDRLERVLLAWAMWMGAFCPGSKGLRGQDSTAQKPTIQFEVDSTAVTDPLNKLADTATTEHLRCLTGGPVNGWWELILFGDTPYHRARLDVDGLVTPRITFQNQHRINYKGCPASTVGIWHNHLTLEMISMGPGGVWTTGGRVPPESRCFLSEVDIYGDDPKIGNIVYQDEKGEWLMKKSAVLLYIVQTDATHRCWWLAAQVMSLMREKPGTTRIYPIEGQRSW